MLTTIDIKRIMQPVFQEPDYRFQTDEREFDTPELELDEQELFESLEYETSISEANALM